MIRHIQRCERKPGFIIHMSRHNPEAGYTDHLSCFATKAQLQELQGMISDALESPRPEYRGGDLTDRECVYTWREAESQYRCGCGSTMSE